uniref:Uncharacterized protein n=1 Tax=Ciona savignyi TaxID=51511 RepID=H2YRJ4_CIOSA
MDNSSKKKMAPALHNTDHEHDTVTIKHCFKVPPESPESALTVRNDGIYTKMNGSYSPLSPVSDDVHEAATDIDQSIKATNRPLAHAVQSSVSPYSNRGDSGDFVCRGNQEQGYKTPHKNDICQSQAQPCGDGLPTAPKSNGWPHKLQSDEASVNSKLNGGKNHVLLTENQGTDQRHTEINGRTSESSLNDPTEVRIKTTSDLNTKSSIANSYSTTIKSVLHSLNASSVAINEMIPRDEYTDQQLKNGEQIESDSLQVSSNPTTTPV